MANVTPKREWFCMWWPQTIALSFSFLTESSLVWCSASVLVTTGSMRGYLQPSQVAKVVELLQDGTSIHALARRVAVSPSTVSRAWRRYQEPGCYMKRAGQGSRRASTQQKIYYQYLLLCAGRDSRLLVCMLLTKLSETDSLRVAMVSTGTCAHSPALYSSIGIHKGTTELAELAPRSLHR